MQVYSRSQHPISRKNISKNALKVLSRLNKAGFHAYLVGGGVRDLLLGNKPKDFDITTNAKPEEVKALFRNCRLIGRRFRLAHVLFGREIIEVATFRSNNSTDSKDQLTNANTGRILRDNVYGTTLEEDAARRDFTINAMYYSLTDFTVKDYANGFNDLKNKTIRLIGDPQVRYSEDPVRMLRAIRFAVKLDMQIAPESAKPISEMAHLLKDIPAARLFDESGKLFQSGYGKDTFATLRSYGILEQIFPIVDRYIKASSNSNTEQMINVVLDSTDKRILQGKRINPAFFFAAMLWYPTLDKVVELQADNAISFHDALILASEMIIKEQVKSIAIPKRYSATVKEIWQLQARLSNRSGRRAYRMLTQPRFRAAFDFLEMRAQIEQGEVADLANWWHLFQSKDLEYREFMLKSLNGPHKNKQSRRQRRYKKVKAPKEI